MKILPISCPETSAKNCHSVLSEIPEKRKPVIRQTKVIFARLRELFFEVNTDGATNKTTLKLEPKFCNDAFRVEEVADCSHV